MSSRDWLLEPYIKPYILYLGFNGRFTEPAFFGAISSWVALK